MRSVLVVFSLSLMVLLAACSKKSAMPTQPNSSANSVPNWTDYGFPTVLDSVKITPGTPDSIVSGPYTLQIPGNVFAAPVEFDLLSGDTNSFAAKAPSGEMPILAFAFKVTDLKTDTLVGGFQNALTLTAKDPEITTNSWYYNIYTDGTYSLNSTGMKVSTGELIHPIKSAIVGWVITAPTSTGGGGSGY